MSHSSFPLGHIHGDHYHTLTRMGGKGTPDGLMKLRSHQLKCSHYLAVTHQ